MLQTTPYSTTFSLLPTTLWVDVDSLRVLPLENEWLVWRDAMLMKTVGPCVMSVSSQYLCGAKSLSYVLLQSLKSIVLIFWSFTELVLCLLMSCVCASLYTTAFFRLIFAQKRLNFWQIVLLRRGLSAVLSGFCVSATFLVHLRRSWGSTVWWTASLATHLISSPVCFIFPLSALEKAVEESSEQWIFSEQTWVSFGLCSALPLFELFGSCKTKDRNN